MIASATGCVRAGRTPNKLAVLVVAVAELRPELLDTHHVIPDMPASRFWRGCDWFSAIRPHDNDVAHDGCVLHAVRSHQDFRPQKTALRQLCSHGERDCGHVYCLADSHSLI